MISSDDRSLKYLLKPALSFAFFAIALLACHHLLIEVRPGAIREALHNVSPFSFSAALAATAFSFLMLIGYEYTAAKYAGTNLPLKTLAFGGFCAFAVSNSVGFSFFSGGTVRYRLYSPYGLSGADIAKMTLFSSGAFLSILPVLFFLVVLTNGVYAASLLKVSESLLVMIAAVPIIFYAFTFGYLYRGRLPKSSRYTWFSRIHSYPIELPGLRLGVTQLVFTILDLLAAGSVLYVLLPSPPHYGIFMLVYLLAIAVGVLSNIPGGLGVFETIILAAFSSSLDAATTTAALFLYRLVYYALPLFTACLLLLGNELYHKKDNLGRLVRSGSGLTPPIMAILVFLAGLLLIFSGSTPTWSEHLKLLRVLLPTPLIDTFHLVAAVIGVFCLLLANGLYKRLSGAWLLTSILLVFGGIFALLKGLDWGTASFLLFTAALLISSRRSFHRTSRMNRLSFSFPYLMVVCGILAVAGWLVFFCYKNTEYTQELWWQFGLHANASRSLRALFVCAVIVLCVGVRWLMRSPFHGRLPTDAELKEAEILSKKSSRPDTALVLSGDKMLLFNEEKDAFLMYGRYRKSLISLYDPVGPPEKRSELVWQFMDQCDRYLLRPVFYQVATENLPMYLDIGLTAFKIGEEAVVDLAEFDLQSSKAKELRHIYRRGLSEGLSLEIYEPGRAPVSELARISDQWLKLKHVREKGFSLGRFDETYLNHFRIAALQRNQQIVAFANLFEPDGCGCFSFDLMRYADEAPKSTMTFFIVALAQHFKEKGLRQMTLGMAPLSGMAIYRKVPLAQKLESLMYQKGGYFYNFHGLRSFKEKFHPHWESRYIVIPRNENLLFAIADASLLIAGGFTGMIGK